MKLYVIKMGEGYLAGRSPDGNLVVTDSRRHACRWLRQAARDKVSRLGKCFRLVRLVPKKAKPICDCVPPCKTFQCVGCRRDTHWCCGVADEHSVLCDDCADTRVLSARRDTARRIAEWLRERARTRGLFGSMEIVANAIETGEWEQSKGENDNGK